MKAAVYDRFGGPEELKIAEVPKPEPGNGEVLVRVKAAAINPIDWKIRSGRMALIAGRKFPKRTGIDFSGVVEACGPGTVGLKPGDAVLGVAKGLKSAHGSFSEFCLANADFVLRKPGRLTDGEAAAVPIAGLTALQALRNSGIGKGGRVMIVGASGGVGTFAVQIAKAHGAHVTAVCSTHGMETCRRLGADVVIDRTQEDPLASRALFDAILDFAPAYSFAKCRPLLTAGGHYLNASPGLSTIWAQVWTRFLARKKAHAFIMRRSAGDLKELGTMLAAGSVTPVVSRTFDFNEEGVREIHRTSEERRTIGKLVVGVGRD